MSSFVKGVAVAATIAAVAIIAIGSLPGAERKPTVEFKSAYGLQIYPEFKVIPDTREVVVDVNRDKKRDRLPGAATADIKPLPAVPLPTARPVISVMPKSATRVIYDFSGPEHCSHLAQCRRI